MALFEQLMLALIFWSWLIMMTQQWQFLRLKDMHPDIKKKFGLITSNHHNVWKIICNLWTAGRAWADGKKSHRYNKDIFFSPGVESFFTFMGRCKRTRQQKKFRPGKRPVEKVWPQNTLINFLAKLDNFKKITFSFLSLICFELEQIKPINPAQ